MRVRHGVGIEPGGDQPGIVRNVRDQPGAGRVGYGAHAREVDLARIGGAAGEDQAWPGLTGKTVQFVIVDPFVILANAVRCGLEPPPRQADGRSVRQVAAAGEIEPHDPVARIEQREQDSDVGVRARMGLHIGMGRAEQPTGPADGELLDPIDRLAAAIVAAAGIALGIFVGEDRALRGPHLRADDVLRRDQLDMILLPSCFLPDGDGEFAVDRCCHCASPCNHSVSILRAASRKAGPNRWASSRKARGSTPADASSAAWPTSQRSIPAQASTSG